MAYTTACTTAQAVITQEKMTVKTQESFKFPPERDDWWLSSDSRRSSVSSHPCRHQL